MVTEVDSLRHTFDPAMAELLARCDSLIQKASERGVARCEIDHYKKKIAALANEAVMDSSKHAKAESNVQK